MSKQYDMLWTVLGDGTKPGFWLCQCQCGTKREVNKKNIKAKLSRSCGKCVAQDTFATRQKDMAKKRIKHGGSGTPEYAAWAHMKDRCTNPNSNAWDDYGGRGIKVCEQWSGSDGFAQFIIDMGPRPSPEHSLDRKDNEGDYTPDNCCWATREEQQRHKRTSKMIEHNGRTQCLQAWADEYEVGAGVLGARLDMGWTFERAVAEAVRYNRLTKEQVIEIKRRHDPGSRRNGAVALAEEFGVSYQTIIRIANGEVQRYEALLDDPD